jgi:hypothetical protein
MGVAVGTGVGVAVAAVIGAGVGTGGIVTAKVAAVPVQLYRVAHAGA